MQAEGQVARRSRSGVGGRASDRARSRTGSPDRFEKPSDKRPGYSSTSIHRSSGAASGCMIAAELIEEATGKTTRHVPLSIADTCSSLRRRHPREHETAGSGARLHPQHPLAHPSRFKHRWAFLRFHFLPITRPLSRPLRWDGGCTMTRTSREIGLNPAPPATIQPRDFAIHAVFPRESTACRASASP